MAEYSDFIVFVDESGDHGLVTIDSQFPVFALIFCVVRKEEYIQDIVPAVQHLKFETWGHDAVVLHEREIRKSEGDFAFLQSDAALRERFYEDLNALMDSAPLTVFASVIDKIRLRNKYSDPWNPYEIALRFCMEKLHTMLTKENQQGRSVHIIFESRGKREDGELELEFRRISDNNQAWGYVQRDFGRFDFRPVFVPKAANLTGLQIADLIARPVALSYLRPNQRSSNRAFGIIQPKLRGMKVFPRAV